jgi:hypothetical protein
MEGVNLSPVFLTEKEEQALRRMEQLTELRRAADSLNWRVYVGFVAQLGPPGFFIYRFCSEPVTKFSIGLMVIAAVWIMLNFAWFFIVVPMKRRIDALAQLLEDEIKRSR